MALDERTRAIELMLRFAQVVEDMNRLQAIPFAYVPRHVQVIVLLVREQALTVGALGRLVGLSPTRTSHLVDEMERSGLVVRVRDDRDRRVVRVRLTPATRTVAQRIYDTRMHVAAAALEEHGPGDRDAFIRVLDSLVQGFERLREDLAGETTAGQPASGTGDAAGRDERPTRTPARQPKGA